MKIKYYLHLNNHIWISHIIVVIGIIPVKKWKWEVVIIKTIFKDLLVPPVCKWDDNMQISKHSGMSPQERSRIQHLILPKRTRAFLLRLHSTDGKPQTWTLSFKTFFSDCSYILLFLVCFPGLWLPASHSHQKVPLVRESMPIQSGSSWPEHRPVHWWVVGSIPGQDTYRGFGLDPGRFFFSFPSSP